MYVCACLGARSAPCQRPLVALRLRRARVADRGQPRKRPQALGSGGHAHGPKPYARALAARRAGEERVPRPRHLERQPRRGQQNRSGRWGGRALAGAARAPCPGGSAPGGRGGAVADAAGSAGRRGHGPRVWGAPHAQRAVRTN